MSTEYLFDLHVESERRRNQNTIEWTMIAQIAMVDQLVGDYWYVSGGQPTICGIDFGLWRRYSSVNMLYLTTDSGARIAQLMYTQWPWAVGTVGKIYFPRPLSRQYPAGEYAYSIWRADTTGVVTTYL